jgi:uncharacterized protein YneF (UPF0154 family)
MEFSDGDDICSKCSEWPRCNEAMIRAMMK